MSLSAIHIKNFAVIHHAEIEFENGLTAITGDTGAGKSILLDALSLLLGARGESGLIRHTEDKAEISAFFDLSHQPDAQQWLIAKGFTEEVSQQTECLIRRVLRKDKPSRCYINDQATTLASLKSLGGLLVDLHNQHEHQSLLRAHTQRSIIDDYSALQTSLHTLKHQAQRIFELSQLLEQNDSKQKELHDRVDLIAFQLNELLELDIVEGEFEALEQEYQRLNHSETIAHGLQSLMDTIFHNEKYNLSDQLGTHTQKLRDLAELDSRLHSPLELLSCSLTYIEESKSEIESALSSLESNPERHQEIQQRIDSYITLARKHLCKENQLLNKQNTLQAELANLQHDKESPEKLRTELSELKQQYQKLALRISQERQHNAKILSQKITQQMQELGLEGGEFCVQITQDKEPKFHSYGIDSIEFLVRTNQGMPLKSLTKTASGGELSRISLAIQMIASNKTNTPTLIFDEVDVGIGGNIASKVGECLKRLSHNTQVLCITHQAQVASQANQHILADKQQQKNHTESTFSVLNMHERTQEIARMLGNKQTSANTLAKELLGNN